MHIYIYIYLYIAISIVRAFRDFNDDATGFRFAALGTFAVISKQGDRWEADVRCHTYIYCNYTLYLFICPPLLIFFLSDKWEKGVFSGKLCGGNINF